MDNIVLSNVDCLEYIKTIPDKSVDLILTDPPYNIAQYSTGNIPLPGRSAVNNDLGEWDLKEINPFDFVDDFKRILKPDGNIFIFTSYNLIGKWHEVFDPEFDTFQYFIWHKTNPKDEIESVMGLVLDWRELPERKASRIIIEKEVTFDNRATWSQQFDYIMDVCMKMKKAFKKYL